MQLTYEQDDEKSSRLERSGQRLHLAVVIPDDAPRERRSSRLAYTTLRGTATAADVVLFTQSNFRRRLHIPASLPATVEREGGLLYAAA